MKLVTFKAHGETKAGVIEESVVIDVHKSYRQHLLEKGTVRALERAQALAPNDVKGILEGGEDSHECLREAVSFAKKNPHSGGEQLIYERSEVSLQAPLSNPQKILCVGLNYQDHILEMGRDMPEYPVTFAKFANTIIGPEDNIPKYSFSEKLDYEAEFAIVIGKQAKNVREAEALQYAGGYTIANDITYRDLQKRTLQWLQGKSVDGTAPLGPWIVTPDELKDPDNLEISLTVNGEERQHSNTENLVFDAAKLIAFYSELLTLEPGDIILSGTPGGVGAAGDPQTFLQEGDTVEIRVDGIGLLKNTVQNAGKGQ
ncbi:fumarylacetoacetate hydrolase family protein [Salibacterium sp. K-3]